MEDEQVSMDTVALWLGEIQINFKLAQKQIIKLKEENERLNKMLAETKLKELKDEKD